MPPFDCRFEIKKLDFLTSHCVLLALARQEESGHQLIILYVCNIISSEFLLFSILSSFWIQDAKSKKNVWAPKVCLDRRASS